MTQPVCSKEVWTARLRDFLHDCAGSAPSEEHDRIREAVLLLLHDPRPRDDNKPHRAHFDPVAIEAMLGCNASESAVLALIGPDDTFMLSRGMNGTCLATLVMADGSEEMICEAATLSLALLAAYVSKLLTVMERRNQEKSQARLPLGVRLH